MSASCYRCGSAATSREHAPPLCIFPKVSDTDDGTDYRVNLITVPACDEHNLGKAKDDEYLQLVLIHGYFNGPIAKPQFTTKLTRALQRRPALLAALHEHQTPVYVDGVQTVAVDIDRERFDRCLDLVTRALYYHEFDQRLELPIVVATPLLLDMDSADADERNDKVLRYSRSVRDKLESFPRQGSNPEIFWFKMQRSDDASFVACHMCFYSGFDVFAVASQRFKNAA